MNIGKIAGDMVGLTRQVKDQQAAIAELVAALKESVAAVQGLCPLGPCPCPETKIQLCRTNELFKIAEKYEHNREDGSI